MSMWQILLSQYCNCQCYNYNTLVRIKSKVDFSKIRCYDIDHSYFKQDTDAIIDTYHYIKYKLILEILIKNIWPEILAVLPKHDKIIIYLIF